MKKGEPSAEKDSGGAASSAVAVKKEPPSKAVRLIARAIESADDNGDGWVHLGAVGSRILAAAPDFKAHTYGCPNLITLVEKSGGFEVRKGPGNVVHIRCKTAGRKA